MPYRVYIKTTSKRRCRVYAEEFINDLLPARDEFEAQEKALFLLNNNLLQRKTGETVYEEEAEKLVLEFGHSYRPAIEVEL